MSFLERILRNLAAEADHPFLQEARPGELVASTGADLLGAIGRVRRFVRGAGLTKGDRCALLAGNSAAWVAADLALLAEGVVVVPLYGRQRAAELAAILRDCSPKLLLCDDPSARDAIRAEEPGAPPAPLLPEILAGDDAPGRGAGSVGGNGDGDPADPSVPTPHAADDPVAIVYTSGTSGEPKGVVLTVGNLDFMVARASERLDRLVEGRDAPERVYHYLPWCFAGAWILLLLCLARRSVLTLNTDLSRIVDDLRVVRPHYFQNVPVVLERMRDGVERAMRRRRGARALYEGARRAFVARADGLSPARRDAAALALARRFLFPSIRRKIAPELRALVCGSAPLARETQLFFEMLGIQVLQVYGLTETTAICTMDVPGDAVAGTVGRAIEGIEMRRGERDEILVRGPNVFAGYWNRPDATKRAFTDGWLRTGDRGAVDDEGRWRVLGRLKNLIVLGSGHNVAPEPIEDELRALLPGAEQIVLVGSGRPHLAAIVTGNVTSAEMEGALARLNEELPSHRRIRGSLLREEPFTVESGLVTANGKLRREAVADRLHRQIEELYAREEVGA